MTRIGNDHQGREARPRRCSGRSRGRRGRGKEGRVLMEGNIGRSYIMMGIRIVHPVAFLCPRVANKHAFESTRGEFR